MFQMDVDVVVGIPLVVSEQYPEALGRTGREREKRDVSLFAVRPTFFTMLLASQIFQSPIWMFLKPR